MNEQSTYKIERAWVNDGKRGELHWTESPMTGTMAYPLVVKRSSAVVYEKFHPILFNLKIVLSIG